MTPAQDRRVVLALCAREHPSDANAFTAAETWRLMADLRERGMRPSDLIAERADARLAQRLAALENVDALEQRYAAQGLWILTPVDRAYPHRIVDRLGFAAPVLLYGAGSPDLLAQDGVGVVGSRDLAPEATMTTERLGRAIAESGATLVSGGARGADQVAMTAAATRGGAIVGVLAHPLEREARRQEAHRLLAEQRLCLISPFKPSAGFRPANAMARNKIVYGLTRCTAVVACDEGRGGTWAGATEALRRGFGPVAVWTGAGAGEGNGPLAERGAQPFAEPDELLAVTREAFAFPARAADQLTLRM